VPRIASVVGIATSLAIAIPFEHWIDRPSISLSRMSNRLRWRLVPLEPLTEAA
jgi:hypothetical protein